MPRTTNQTKVRVFLPAHTLQRLQLLSVRDEAPLAETLRRLCDLAVTFDFPPPSIPIAVDASPPTPFVLHMPDPLTRRFTEHAQGRALTFDAHLAAVATVYMAKRARERHATLEPAQRVRSGER